MQSTNAYALKSVKAFITKTTPKHIFVTSQLTKCPKLIPLALSDFQAMMQFYNIAYLKKYG